MTDIQNISAASAGEAVDEELIEQAYEMMAGGQPAGEKPEQTGAESGRSGRQTSSAGAGYCSLFCPRSSML